MAEFSFTLDPSNSSGSDAHSTSVVYGYSLNSENADAVVENIKVGSTSSSGGSGHKHVSIIYGNLPQKFDVFGDTDGSIFDDSMEVTNMKLVMTPSTADTDTEFYEIYAIKGGETFNFPNNDLGLPVYAGVCRDTSNPGGGSGVIRKWRVDASTEVDEPSGNPSIDDDDIKDGGPVAFFRPDATSEITIDLKQYVDTKSLTWGDRFFLLIEKTVQANEDKFFEVGTGRTTTPDLDLQIFYEDPAPTAPVINLTPDTDLKSAIVTMTTKPTERDLQSFDTVFKVGAPDTTNNKFGVDYNTDSNFRKQNFTLDSAVLKQSDSQIAPNFLATEGQEVSLVVYANDQNQRSMSNVVNHSRLSVNGSLSPTNPTIGQEATLTISGFSDSGDSSAADFVKYGVNWDGNSSPESNDSLDDYSLVTLDAPANSITVKHTYDKAQAYKINVFVVDSKGFRSDFTTIATPTVPASDPVAKLNVSRDSAIRAKYGDDFSVVTLSLAHSFAVGSDRKLLNFGFKHDITNTTTPMSTNPIENNNIHFNEGSKRIRVTCNQDNCEGTVLKIFGRISVESDGSDVEDSAATFDHYEMKAITISPPASTNNATSFTTSTEFFKSVDFVVIVNLDANDNDNPATYYSIDAGAATQVVNNQIRGEYNQFGWGGYAAALSTGDIEFHAANKTITRTSGNFISDGFAVGDVIYCLGPDEASNNRYFTIASLTTTVITTEETPTHDSADAGVQIYKFGKPTITFTSEDQVAPTITGVVEDVHANQTADVVVLDTSSEVTQKVTFESEALHTLDLDSLANSQNISIQNASLKRSGGVQGTMPLGNRRYPVGTTRTRLGMPLLSVQLRILDQTGYRALWSLVEGDRYNWVTIDSKKVDLPSNAYKQLRLRLLDGTINKSPSLASQYTASLQFVVVGELVS
tara:strand:+ start:2639 stop:5389 length:2751 start_codon:yes stop_codon:yes gene_type:complete